MCLRVLWVINKMKDKYGEKLSSDEVLQKGINRVDGILLDLELMILRWIGHVPFHSIRKYFYRLSGMKIGKGSNIHMWARFFEPAGISVGEDTIVGNNVFLDGRASIKIGNHVDVAAEVMIYSSQHDIDDPKFKAVFKPVDIGSYVFIGPRAIILPGVTIGEGAIVAAGAVVSRDVAPFTVVGGVPATKIRDRKLVDPQYILGRARNFQ